MIELPEAITLVKQINDTLKGRQILHVMADYSPHKFAWYHGDPQGYGSILKGNTIEEADSCGGMVRIRTSRAMLLLGDGINLRYYEAEQETPPKHQLLLELEDGAKATASVQMYGGIWCFGDERDFQNPYYEIAKKKPSPVSEAFDERYFEEMLSAPGIEKLSIKAFLATEQRMPGFGNGVLQDVLWHAGIHPKGKMKTLDEAQTEQLFKSIKTVLSKMVELGGRDTEKDFFGNNGGYRTHMSKNNVDAPCPKCGQLIQKENYMGGSVYYCGGCQPV